jgi:hypothetical protein
MERRSAPQTNLPLRCRFSGLIGHYIQRPMCTMLLDLVARHKSSRSTDFAIQGMVTQSVGHSELHRFQQDG